MLTASAKCLIPTTFVIQGRLASAVTVTTDAQTTRRDSESTNQLAKRSSRPFDKQGRARTAQDTISRSADITASTASALRESYFIAFQLPPLTNKSTHDAKPDIDLILKPIQVYNDDAFNVTRRLATDPAYVNKIAVLKHDFNRRFRTTQEDALCCSSTLFRTLQQSRGSYLFRNHMKQTESNNCAAIFSPQWSPQRCTLE
jgi:hypothetical protein